MTPSNFRTLDLNLLRVFDEVMTERSLTRAAHKLSLTQPAVSNALRRFREAMGDELIKRSGQEMAPTPRALALWPAVAWAGMPFFGPDESSRRLVLSDAGRLRYEAISFFIVVLLLSALIVRWLWNRLACDFPKLPRLNFGKALGVVLLWGLLFLVVLTMIATTREMMTPGVWEKQGLLYKIPTDQPRAKP